MRYRLSLTCLLLAISPHLLAAEPAASRSASSATSLAGHIAQLKKRLPSSGFTVVAVPPFVVVGDEPATEVRRHASYTVKWAVDHLKKTYFDRDPAEILDIWLFKDAESYERNAKALFGEKPDTPFGYYSPEHKALVMNIATGGGTLVHEIVHPFIAANFPRCPTWFNEGLASLYEQCAEGANGEIRGLTNWRLAGLQKATRANRVMRFKDLCATTTHQFYEEDRGANYAQARYLCYYLQERGLLEKFYKRFKATAQRDPSGYAALCEVLGSPDMTAFQREWETFVLGLRFP